MKYLGLLLFLTLIVVLWLKRPQEELAPEQLSSEEKVIIIEQEHKEPPTLEVSAPQQVRTPIQTPQERRPRERAAQDPYSFAIDEDATIPITSFVVVDNYALAFGDILVAPIEDILDLERRGLTPRLPSPTLWPNGIVPYQIDPEIDQYEIIRDVLDYFQSLSNVQFVPYSDQENYVIFESGNEHCFAHLGMIGGPQKVVLSPGCLQREIAHEIMHVLGFLHEQNRMDRDEHINIHWDHISQEFHEQFKKLPTVFSVGMNNNLNLSESQLQRVLGFSFDSIMLYSPFIFTRDPSLPSMSTKDGSPWRNVQDQTHELLGERDIERLRLIYGR